MAGSSSITKLSSAANALKAAGSSIPINKQIDTVSNALTGTQRKREMTVQEKGYPPEAKNVLEILKIQVNIAITSLTEKAQDEHVFNKFVDDLEIIEAFAERIMKFYEPKEEPVPSDIELTKSVKHTFARAKAEAVTTLALEKIYSKISNLEYNYRNNPKMTNNEFRQKLEEISIKVRKWEDEVLPGDPLLQESKGIPERIYKLKTKLLEAIEISELSDHPGVIGQMGLDILRLASGMVQQAKSQFEIEQGVMMALDANKNLKRSGGQFQEKGRTFNLLIQQSISVFVDRQIRKLETELKSPLYYVPGDTSKNEEVANRLINQMERLLTYFEFVHRWAGPHQEDLLERIALVYEQIVDRSRKAKYLILDEACCKGTSEEEARLKARVATKYRRAETMGRDIIDPEAIFHEKKEIKDKIKLLLERIPDPTFNFDQTIPEDKLGRVYYEALCNLNKAVDYEDQQRLKALLNRIEYYAMRHKREIDIFDEMVVRWEYIKEVINQEVDRFLILLGVEPSVTNEARYEKYQDPSEYPFKGNQLVKVINNYRVIDNFLQGRYGEVAHHPTLKMVSEGFYNELEGYSEKVLIELQKRLKLQITRPLKIEEIGAILEARIRGLPDELKTHVRNSNVRVASIDIQVAEHKKEAAELQELWLMLEYLKYPVRMKYIEHLDMLSKNELLSLSQKLVQETSPDLIPEIVRQIKESLQTEAVEFPLTEQSLDKLSDERVARVILRKFIQLHDPSMRDIQPFSELLLDRCQSHKRTAERIIVPLAIKNPGLIQKLVIESLEDAIRDSVRLFFELHSHTISDLNQENQFYNDHQFPENLPLYVHGLTTKRAENESVSARLLDLLDKDQELALKIESLATRSLFNSPLNRIKSFILVLAAILGVTTIEAKLEDCTQFLFFDKEKKECILTGFGLLVIVGPLPETGHIDEIGNIIMQVEARISKNKEHNVRVSFIDKSYNSFISEFREGKTWNLL